VDELSPSEHFIIWRRREGLSQRQAAAPLGLSQRKLYQIEREEIKNYKGEMPFLGSLYSYEKCFIFRRRSGWTIERLAVTIGVSRYWCNLMELGKAPVERLVDYWAENEGQQ
jgi:DNA-binding XRE family transcriptional regulator